MRIFQKKIRKSKLTLPRYKKEKIDNLIHSSSEDIIEIGEEKKLYCIDLRNNFFQKTKAPIIKYNSSNYLNRSKAKTKTHITNKNNFKNKRYKNNTKKSKLIVKLFLNDSLTESEEESEEDEYESENKEDEEEEVEKYTKKEKSKIKTKQKSKFKFKKLTLKDFNFSISSSSSNNIKSNNNKSDSNKITSNNSSDSESQIN